MMKKMMRTNNKCSIINKWWRMKRREFKIAITKISTTVKVQPPNNKRVNQVVPSNKTNSKCSNKKRMTRTTVKKSSKMKLTWVSNSNNSNNNNLCNNSNNKMMTLSIQIKLSWMKNLKMRKIMMKRTMMARKLLTWMISMRMKGRHLSYT